MAPTGSKPHGEVSTLRDKQGIRRAWYLQLVLQQVPTLSDVTKLTSQSLVLCCLLVTWVLFWWATLSDVTKLTSQSLVLCCLLRHTEASFVNTTKVELLNLITTACFTRWSCLVVRGSSWQLQLDYFSYQAPGSKAWSRARTTQTWSSLWCFTEGQASMSYQIK